VTEERRLWVTGFQPRASILCSITLMNFSSLTTANSLIVAQEGSKHVADIGD